MATERVVNGGFVDGTGWAIANSAWSIADGVATTNGLVAGNGLNQTITLIGAGSEVIVAVECISNGSGSLLRVIATSAGTPVQTFYAGVPADAERISASTAAAADFDGIRFEVDSAGSNITIDNVSLRS